MGDFSRSKDMTMTAETVANWTLEETEYHTVPVPKMPREEREAWHRLSHEECTRKLSKDETRLLRALNRKLRNRVAFERE